MTSSRKLSTAILTMACAFAGAFAGVSAPRALRAQDATAATAATTIPVSLFGEVRARAEWDQPGGALHANLYTYLRSRLGVRADPVKGVRIVAQLQDSRVFGAEGNTTASNPDVFDLHQGYLELYGNWRSDKLAVRVGRQEIALANERLVGAVDWTNTGRSFDGLRILLTPDSAGAAAGRWAATLFASTVEERGRKFGALTAAGATQDSLPNHNAFGLFASRVIATGALEATALLDAGNHYRVYDESNRATFDLRLRQGAGRDVGFDLEAAWQTGTQRYHPANPAAVLTQDVNAWLLSARLTRPAAPGRTLTAALGADILSGDATPTDGNYSAFSTMFATNHPFYGLMDLFTDPAARTNDRGLVDMLATTAIALPPRTTLKVELHHFSPQAGPPAEIGWEGDVVVPVKLTRIATLELGYTAFRAGPAAPAMGLGPDGSWRQWSYLQLKASF